MCVYMCACACVRARVACCNIFEFATTHTHNSNTDHCKVARGMEWHGNMLTCEPLKQEFLKVVLYATTATVNVKTESSK